MVLLPYQNIAFDVLAPLFPIVIPVLTDGSCSLCLVVIISRYNRHQSASVWILPLNILLTTFSLNSLLSPLLVSILQVIFLLKFSCRLLRKEKKKYALVIIN